MAISPYVRSIRRLVGDALLLLPAVTAAVLDDDDRLLLIDHVTAGNWVLPGGAIEPNERPEDALRREVREETGLDVEPEAITGVYGGPEFEIRYTNGDRVAYVMALYRCRVIGGDLVLDGEEARDGRFVSREEANALPLATWARIVLDECFAASP